MKLKIDSCISTGKEFYGTIYPESKDEVDYLDGMIEIGESEKIEFVEDKENAEVEK